jgi:hypothetical protein
VPGGSATSTEVSQGLKVGIIIAAIIVPLVGIIMGLIYMLDSNASPEKKGVGRTWLFVGIGAIVLWIILFSSV